LGWAGSRKATGVRSSLLAVGVADELAVVDVQAVRLDHQLADSLPAGQPGCWICAAHLPDLILQVAEKQLIPVTHLGEGGPPT
jgi:hypothetical protein